MATIKIKRKTTSGGSAPTTEGEISTNIADKKIFIGTGSGVVTYIDETQVDTKIGNAVSSAFVYKGAVSGNGQNAGTTAASATALAATPGTGDYYRIDTKGFVKANGAADTNAFYVNVGDAVVYNSSSWDVIDNSNSGVSAGDSSITVTGSADAGFQVAVATVDGGTY